MSDAAKSSPSRKRTERIAGNQSTEASSPEEIAASAGHYRAATQDKLGQALSDLLENPW